MDFSSAARTVFGLVCASVIGACTVAPTLAQSDPPGRVARISELAGDVRTASPSEAWQPAYRNEIVTAGDNVWVGDTGRAELDLGPVQLWLSGGANVYFEQFDDQQMVARLATGALAVRIRRWEPQDAMRVATNMGEVSFTAPGLYIVTAGDGYAASSITARSGQAEVSVGGRIQSINSGETLSFDQGGFRRDRFAYNGVAWGEFESWVSARDRRTDRWEQRNRGASFVNPWMIGLRDLDDHGYWESSFEYGRIWYPRSVGADWAPYRYGRWSWIQPWGWTWVDDAAWGFAPSHYGRWVRVNGRWAWWPGSYLGRPVWAPALVTFFGGNNWSVGVSSGPSYAWVPLGWNEPFVPWYTYTPNYWRHVNRPYVRNSAEEPWRPRAYVHAELPNAITAVAAAAFIAGRPVSQNIVRHQHGGGHHHDLRSAPPARMGEVLPQFTRRGVREAVVNQPAVRVDPNPNVRPQVVNPSVTTPPSVDLGAQAPIGRSMPPTMVRERAPVAPSPNLSVPEPRVWQDPNPVIAPRTSVRESLPQPRTERTVPPVTQPSLVAPPAAPVAPARPVVTESAPVRVQEGAPGAARQQEAQPQQPRRDQPRNEVRERAPEPPKNRQGEKDKVLVIQ